MGRYKIKITKEHIANQQKQLYGAIKKLILSYKSF